LNRQIQSGKIFHEQSSPLQAGPENHCHHRPSEQNAEQDGEENIFHFPPTPPARQAWKK
jgi:hypothetical protein